MHMVLYRNRQLWKWLRESAMPPGLILASALPVLQARAAAVKKNR